MTLAQWIDPSDDDVTTVDGTEITAIADKSGVGNDVAGITPASVLASFEGADAATAFTSEDTGARIATFEGDAQIDTAQFKFGTSSLLLDGTGDWVTFPDSPDFAFGSGPFTVECWVRFNGDPGVANMAFVSHYDINSNRSWLIDLNSNVLRFNWSTTGSSPSNISSAWNPVGSQWYHIAVTRDAANDLRLFVDGALLTTVANAVTYFTPVSLFAIGATATGTGPMNGWIEDVRVIKGLALYTAAFTAPAAALGEGGFGPEEATVNLLRAMDFSAGGAMVALNGALTNMDGPDLTIVAAFADDNTTGADNNVVSMSDDTADSDDSGWRMEKPDAATPVKASIGDRAANSVQLFDAVFSGVAALTLDQTLDLMTGYTNGTPQGTDVFVPPVTSLLANLDGADAATSYTSEDAGARVATFVGTAQLDTAQFKFGTASLLVDGNSDSINFPDDALWDLAADDFMVECWVRHNTNTGFQTYVSHYDSQASLASWFIRFDAATPAFQFIYSTSGSGTVTLSSTSWTPTVNTWYHLAAVRRQDRLYLFIDGVQVGDFAFNITIFSVNLPLDLGVVRGGAGPANWFNGWIDGARIVTGASVYDINGFTVPNAAAIDEKLGFTEHLRIGHQPGGANWVDGEVYEAVYFDGVMRSDQRHRVEGYLAHKWATALSLPAGHPFKTVAPDIVNDAELVANFDGSDGATSYTSDDSTGRVATFVGTAELDTAQFKYGSAALLLDGNSDYVSFPDSADWDFGSGDFTIECWARFNGDPGTAPMVFLSHWDSDSDQRGFFFGLSNNEIVFQSSETGTSGTVTAHGEAWNPLGNTWYHAAITRSGNDIRMFIDGAQVGATGTLSVGINNNAEPLIVGALNAFGPFISFFDGWIDSARVTKGTALYVRDFSVPHRGFVIPAPAALLANLNGIDAATVYTSEDSTGHVFTFIGTAELDTAQKAFGKSSLLLDGNSDSVTIPHSSEFYFDMVNDQTAEMWIRPNAAITTAAKALTNKDGISGSVWPNHSISINTNNTIAFITARVGGVNITLTSTATADINVWTHIAVTYVAADDTFRLFINGALEASGVNAQATAQGAGLLQIGHQASSVDDYFPGHIDGVRYTQGRALYTAAFNVPIDAPGEPIV